MFDAGGDSDDEAVDCKLEFFLINPDSETPNSFRKSNFSSGDLGGRKTEVSTG